MAQPVIPKSLLNCQSDKRDRHRIRDLQMQLGSMTRRKSLHKNTVSWRNRQRIRYLQFDLGRMSQPKFLRSSNVICHVFSKQIQVTLGKYPVVTKEQLKAAEKQRLERAIEAKRLIAYLKYGRQIPVKQFDSSITGLNVRVIQTKSQVDESDQYHVISTKPVADESSKNRSKSDGSTATGHDLLDITARTALGTFIAGLDQNQTQKPSYHVDDLVRALEN